MPQALHCAPEESRGGDRTTAHPHLPHWMGRECVNVCVCVCVCSSSCQKSPSLISLRPHHPFHSSCFAESANVSEKPLDAEREKEPRAEEVGTDGSDPASPSWALSSGDSILGIRSLPGSFPTVSVGGDGGAQDLFRGCDFSFLFYDRSIRLPRLPGKQRMHFLSKVE